ncbi:MAG: pitrilysin family protein [Verrucomicrobiota bacterium JB023]|nr:pitrilysin family protein [Verrucomicrobiota bacterium JB023]
MISFPSTSASKQTLPCGLTVILDPNGSAPVVSAQIWVETGSRDEHDHAGAGLSHLLEHMVFKGTKSFDCTNLAQSVQEKGGHWNAYTSFDRTVYYIDGPSTSTDFFLKALTELVFSPLLPLEDFETEKDVIRREIDMGLDDPDSVASHLLFENAYQHDLRRHPVIGHLDRFNELTHEDLLTYHHERYRPANAFLVLSGDFQEGEILKTLRELTGDLKNQPVAPLISTPEPRPAGRRIARKTFSTPVSHLTFSWLIPGATHHDTPALELLAQALGGGISSPLYQRFRETTGLTHQIYTWPWTPPAEPGLFAISAEVDYENREQLEELLLTELPVLVDGLTEADLAKARRQMAASQFRTLTTASGRASDLGSNWHEARNLDFTKDYLAALAEVTLTEVRQVARTYLRGELLTITSLDPEDKVPEKPQLSLIAHDEPAREHVLSNGLRVILKRDDRIPAVYLQTAFLAGATVESPETCGLGNLHASTFLKGTEKRSSVEYADALESLGARLRLGVGNNTALLGGFCLAPDLKEYLGLVAEALIHPLFTSQSLEIERATQIAAIEEAAEDPLKMGFYHLRKKLFGDHHYGLPKLGLAETIESITPIHLQQHHRKYFVAKNATLVLHGDLPDLDETIEMLEADFAALPAGEAFPVKPHLPQTLPVSPAPLTHTLDREQGVLALAWPGLSFDSANTAEAEIFQEYTSNMAGPLFTRIREELGLAYYVSSTQFHGLGAGMFATYLGTSPEQLEFADRELESTLASIAEDGLTQDDLERARTATLSSHALDAQSPASQARHVALDTLLGLGVEHSAAHLDRLKKVSRESINGFAKELLGQENVVVRVSP